MNLAGLPPILDAVAPVSSAFERAGRSLYLVGGVVRDLLVAGGAAPAGDVVSDDIDLTTDARPEQVLDLVRPVADDLWTQGQRFGTIGLTVGGHRLEITTHRAEAYDPTSRKPIVSFGERIEDDLARRDFTVNAMAIEVPGAALHDPFGGAEDLVGHRLRTPLSPVESFTDDPLRMLRAARFMPRFGLVPDADLVDAARELADRLAIVSVERIHDELERLLAVDAPGAGLDFLVTTGLLAEVVPELEAASVDPARAAALASAPGPPTVRRAGLLYPLGSTARRVLVRLRYSRADVTETVELIETASTALGTNVSDATVRRVAHRLGLDGLGDLVQLVTTIARIEAPSDRPEPTTNRQGAAGGATETESSDVGAVPFLARVETLSEREELGRLSPPLTGADLIERFGLEPGPVVGRALAHLQDLTFADGSMSADEATAAVERWLGEHARPR